ncbi:DUF2381 family protein [Archangium gephyra]|nr:DUF2381 family protein [Archangium gephyra]
MTAGGRSLRRVRGWSRGKELNAWQESAIAPGALGHVVVGTEREPGQLGCPCILKPWEAQGLSTVTLGNVTFPPVEQARACE